MERVRLFIKRLSDPSFNKIYMMGMILICLLILGGYFSYSMFTVSKERSNAISIVTGNLTYKLEVDSAEGNKLVVGAGETKEFTVTLSNPNNREARFNFYYVGSLPSGVEAGYKTGDGINVPMEEVGSNLTASGSSGSSNIYKIRVKNESSSSVTITLGVSVGLDYNDLTLPSNGHLFEEAKLEGPVNEIVLGNVGENGDTYDDGTDTFIIGEDPNNYIWYSGKLWRAVSVNNEAKTTKLVTQWNITFLGYGEESSDFDVSYAKEWLNDISEDGFLGNLRAYDEFIVTNAKWDASTNTDSDLTLANISKPDGSHVVTSTVGLLNLYEFSVTNTDDYGCNTYLNNNLYWHTITPVDPYNIIAVSSGCNADPFVGVVNRYGIRPVINLKSDIKIVGGDGTEENPYRLEGDNDTNLNGTKLNTRYSGEYIKFGNEENNLYRIVSHENGTGTKITSVKPLKSDATFITSSFGGDAIFSSTNTIGTFLNGDYLKKYVDSKYSNMIEDNTVWYLGKVDYIDSYKLAKYTDNTMNNKISSVSSKVGLLRYGELMSGQFDTDSSNINYWTLTRYDSSNLWTIDSDVSYFNDVSSFLGIKPALNLKSNVQIINGDGTLNSPFEIQLGS